MNITWLENFLVFVVFYSLIESLSNVNCHGTNRKSKDFEVPMNKNLSRDLLARLSSSESSYKRLETVKRMTKSSHADPVYWNALNATQVHSKYPGLIFMDTYKGPSEAWNAIRASNNLSLYQLEQIFYKSLESFHVLCLDMKRFGNVGDGGWEVCVSKPFNLSKNCLVYSFGIGFDFSFDDDIAHRAGCMIRSFDPSMLVGDHVRSDRVYFYQLGLGGLNSVTPDQWKLNTLNTIKHLLRHDDVFLDVLKMDIEFNEWECLEGMLSDQSLSKVKQLILEIHSPLKFNRSINQTEMAGHYTKMLSILGKLEKASFRRFFYHSNPAGKVESALDGRLIYCCYELYYINLQFL